MSKIRTDLTAAQKDYAIYLPALSAFYSTYIGKQRFADYVDPNRMPKGIPDMEMLNYFNEKEGLFRYDWTLYSAGHVNLDLSKTVPGEDMIRNRGPHTLVVADSGGFQIGKGVWKGEWNNPQHKETEKRRAQVFNWLSNIAEYSMTLDIPAWSYKNPEVAKAIGIYSLQDAISATQYNNEYFIKNKCGPAKFLNVLQGGSNHGESEHWYQVMKKYSDPDQYENHFQGWSMGGANMADIHLILIRIVTLINDGLLQKGVHDWMHFLGTSKMEWGVLLTDIQRAVRQNYNENFTISYDAASPFLATANGTIYHQTLTEHLKRWSYRMSKTADDKKYANDTRLFRDAVLQDKIHPIFEDSPITQNLMIKDICIYAPGDVNKLGKEGRTSWDSFSYTLMMAHNIWHHINAVQEGNRRYDAGIIPSMLVNPLNGQTFRETVNKIFEERDFKKQIQMIKDNEKFWMRVVGLRGMGGKKAISGEREFNNKFENSDDFSNIKELIAEHIGEIEPKSADATFTKIIDNSDEFKYNVIKPVVKRKKTNKIDPSTGLFKFGD